MSGRPRSRAAQVVEAALFIGAAPVNANLVGQAMEELADPDRFERTIRDLANAYEVQRRPYAIRWAGEGYVLELKPPFVEFLRERTKSDRPVRLSREAIEVLSMVAYRQPITRAQIADALGIEPAGILRQLIRRDLIRPSEETESAPEPAYVTTARFLSVFGLESIKDLPATEELGPP
jgi:segregation and condensation protein B